MRETMLCVAVGVLIGSVIGGVIDIALCPQYPTKLRDRVHTIIFWICCILCFSSTVSTIILGTTSSSHVAEREAEEYNNGICTSCGGHMVFFETSKAYRRKTEYFYQCDKCKRTIRTTSFY